MKKEINQTGFSQPILLGAIIFLLLILGGIYFLSTLENQEKSFYQGQLQISNKPSPALNKEATSSERKENKDTSNQQSSPLQKLFSSPELGISFNYLEKTDLNKIDTVKTKILGNKVYVYFREENLERSQLERNQYVEVFSKEKNDDLKTAITKEILKNYSDQNCSADTSKGEDYPDNYELASIQYSKRLMDEGWLASEDDVNKCPTKYTEYQGKAFFLMDKNHSDKFVFFSIGQYGIEGGNGKMWQETIKFIN